MCMWVYVCAGVHASVLACVQRSEVVFLDSFLTLYFEARVSHIKPKLTYESSQESQLAPGSLHLSPVCWGLLLFLVWQVLLRLSPTPTLLPASNC